MESGPPSCIEMEIVRESQRAQILDLGFARGTSLEIGGGERETWISIGAMAAF
jgi:hypothetical protein